MSQASSRLIAAASWGRVALEHGATAGADCVAITIEGSLSADLDGALALAKRWSAERLPSMTPMLSALRDGERLELRRLVPIGSTLRELVQTSGPLTERQVAALFLELAQDLHVCHQRRLVVGELSPDTLFVCPPGREKTAALRIHDAGMSLIVQAAVGERLYRSRPCSRASRRVMTLACGAAPARRDLQALQDAIGFALTGQWPVDADVWSSKRLSDGAPNLVAAQSADAAPPSAETRALAPQPGRWRATTVAAGGGPWELGFLDAFGGTRQHTPIRRSV